ncbi:esterase family protein [Maribacter polysiphoniae]|uniref:Esterase family protein n=1 Tax=Maribacter polysiphoniae TaxID=429344 RepID=A0A316E0N5_9FLAO|nr:alpha/beta hydrolase-fold protein [Maribacter polysiphoniae]MBD1260840.1 esterase family protein [Maribacter polysiphoniae]PWK24024.1 putative esterase [Maribacter polysiphoniae]
MERTIFLFIAFFLTLQVSLAQYPNGKVVYEKLYSKLLENPGGENPTRRVTVYLPPGYDTGEKRYPVIYYLHGFTWNDSLAIAVDKFDKLLDKAIATNKIEPVIVVMPDQYTVYRGSWYTNSTLTGKWADFTGKDLVTFIDKNFRTIPESGSRGIAGHSMGGQGAIKMGMMFPDVFSSVYALSPAHMGTLTEEFGIDGYAHKRITEISSHEQLTTGYAEFLPNVLVSMGRAYSPNLDNPPYYMDFPFEYVGDSIITNYDVIEKWKNNTPVGMIDDHINDLKKLKALKLDWGRNEDNKLIPNTCLEFSKKLEAFGINHYAETYIGNHTNKLWTEDGRALNSMLPFFNMYLKFRE